MADLSFLDWPFFEPRHKVLAEKLEIWAVENLAEVDHDDVDAVCIELASLLGRDGWLNHTAIDPHNEASRLDVRSLCLIRETLARYDGLADSEFAMQGLGKGPALLFRSGSKLR